jgi:hypothetical protein
MMYDNKLVVAILANGKVLREHKDQVYLPFGQDYTLRFKNLNSYRALVRVTVDGQDATEGTTGLIVPANGTVDLERFIKGGNLTTGNKFKFIERTARIENGPRGIQLEDGLIRVEFEFEKAPAKIEDVYVNKHYVDNYPWHRYPRWAEVWCSTNTIGSGSLTSGIARGVKGITSDTVKMGSASTGDEAFINATVSASAGSASFADSATLTSTAFKGVKTFAVPQNASQVNAFVNDVGITVPGALSEQKFEQGAWFPTDGQKHVMVLKLLGVHGEKAITAPVTVKTKQKCPTCGHTNKSGTKFCSECGAGLQLA